MIDKKKNYWKIFAFKVTKYVYLIIHVSFFYTTPPPLWK